MICDKCHRDNKDDAQTCSGCGAELPRSHKGDSAAANAQTKAFVEIAKGGKVVMRRPVDLDKARKGCQIRVGDDQVNLAVGQSKKVGEYEVRVYESHEASLDQPQSPSQPGDADVTKVDPGEVFPKLDGYKITGRIGHGGMGTVWRAVQLSTNRTVALKFLGERHFDSPTAKARFQREVELAAKLEHPNIARVYDSGVNRNIYYYAMELVDGQELDKYIRSKKRNQRQKLELMRTICQAIDSAHRAGIIHRDIKPSNILVTADGQPHVLDFGLAKTFTAEDSGMTISVEGSITGTPAYMSPEQAAGRHDEIDARTDVYSLGVILYRMLTGKSPSDLSGTHIEIMSRILNGQITPPGKVVSDVKGDLEALVLKALALKRYDRYDNAGELADDIDRFLKGDALSACEATTTYILRKRIRKHRMPLGIGAGMVAILVGMFFIMNYWFASRHQSPQGQGNQTALPSEPPMPGNPQEITFDLGNNVNLKLVLIPAGKFMMGSPASEKGHRDNEGPQQEVTISKPFYMGVYAVTQEQYQQIMGTNPSKFKGAQNPVDRVSWNDATDFCKRLSQKTGKKASLPTEAQWEYACRAESTTQFYYGEDQLSRKVGNYAWYVGNSGNMTQPVGMKKPNAWGLYDMHGNVWQWCSDWYADRYANADKTDPLGPESGTERVLRGGSWHTISLDCRSASRFHIDPDTIYDNHGFRVVVECASSVSLAQAKNVQEPVFGTGNAFVNEVAMLPPEQQVARVVAKLKELNPGYDGKESHQIEAGQVVSLRLLPPTCREVTNLTPVRALSGLKDARFGGYDRNRSNLSDLSPLKGLALSVVGFEWTNVTDLSPLAGMPLKQLFCNNNPINSIEPLKGMALDKLLIHFTGVRDLTPLAGMKIQTLWFQGCSVGDLTPLQGMPIQQLRMHSTSIRDLTPLRGMPVTSLTCDPKVASVAGNRDVIRSMAQLQDIHDMPVSEFWKQVDAGKMPSATTPDRNETEQWTTLSNGWRVGKPVNLGPAVNSPEHEEHPFVSADGLTLLFGSNRPYPTGAGSIWMSTRRNADEAWGTAVKLGPPINNVSYNHNSNPCLSPDGLTLYFVSNRPGGQGRLDLWMSTRRSVTDSWGTPQNLGPTINTSGDESTPFVAADGLTLLFASDRPGGQGKWDLWMATRATTNQPWGTPVNLGLSANTESWEESPCLSADGLTLFFNSDRPGGQRGHDLWMSTRRSRTEPFGEPVNLGPTVNTRHFDGGAFISADSRTLYFRSDRPGGQGNIDFWQVPVLPPGVATPTTDEAAWKDAINLLPLIDPAKDAVEGTWKRVDGVLQVSSSSYARLQIPYQPPEEYDARIVFARQTGVNSIWNILAAGGRQFNLCLAGDGGKTFGFERIDGKYISENRSAVVQERGLENGRRYTSLVEVRKDGVKAYLDGRLIAEWKTDYRDMSLSNLLRLPDARTLGIGASLSSVVFYNIEAREVTGKGKLLREPSTPPPPLASDAAWKDAINLLPLIDPQKDAVAGRWTRKDGAIVSDSAESPRLQVPYQPPEEYDYRVSFTWPGKGATFVQFLTKSRRTLRWVIGTTSQKTMFQGFESAGRSDSWLQNPTYILIPKPWEAGTQHNSLIQVRKNSLTAYVDGKLVLHWLTDFSDFKTCTYPMNLRDSSLLGLGGWNSAVSVHSAEVLEITGKGRLIRSGTVTGNPTQELTLDLGNNVGMKLVLIPAGKFMMGSPASEKDRRDDEGPQHEVTISRPFYMCIYLVTQEQYEQITGTNPSNIKGAKNPVECVTWVDAMDFCSKLSQKTGKRVSLPTEAQWEYACRAGSTTRFYYGDDDDYSRLDDYAWYSKNSDKKTHPVGQKKPNDWGLYDMYGNVWQWCADWYANSYANAGNTDPIGPATGTARSQRGGCWGRDALNCRSACRLKNGPSIRGYSLGFRVVVECPSTTSSVQSENSSNPLFRMDEAFIKEVAALGAEQQAARVVAKLKELNPNYDGQEKHEIISGKVVSITIPWTGASKISDLSPVRALAQLSKFDCSGQIGPKDRIKAAFSDINPLRGLPLTMVRMKSSYVSDLSPLKECPLEELDCAMTRVNDLAPLKGLKLTRLSIALTNVTDLAPLEGLPLNNFDCSTTGVTDLSPLKGMPLVTLRLHGMKKLKDLSAIQGMPLQSLTCDPQTAAMPANRQILKSIGTLQMINGYPRDEFWKRVDNGEAASLH